MNAKVPPAPDGATPIIPICFWCSQPKIDMS